MHLISKELKLERRGPQRITSSLLAQKLIYRSATNSQVATQGYTGETMIKYKNNYTNFVFTLRCGLQQAAQRTLR
jgi:hypothetical protein